jgi:hypothetical protein
MTKELSDGVKVPDRMYYYLLEFNEKTNWSFIEKEFGKSALKELTIKEFKKLFTHAFTKDINSV